MRYYGLTFHFTMTYWDNHTTIAVSDELRSKIDEIGGGKPPNDVIEELVRETEQ